MHTTSHEGGSPAQRQKTLELAGPTLTVLLRNPEHDGKPEEFFTANRLSPFVEKSGLIDTGATSVLIGKDIADKLGLRQTGFTTMQGVNRSADALIYAGMIEVPELDYSVTIPVMAPRRSSFASGLLLGRSFLKALIVTYDGPSGMFTIAQPSTDYNLYQSQNEHNDIY